MISGHQTCFYSMWCFTLFTGPGLKFLRWFRLLEWFFNRFPWWCPTTSLFRSFQQEFWHYFRWSFLTRTDWLKKFCFEFQVVFWTCRQHFEWNRVIRWFLRFRCLSWLLTCYRYRWWRMTFLCWFFRSRFWFISILFQVNFCREDTRQFQWEASFFLLIRGRHKGRWYHSFEL